MWQEGREGKGDNEGNSERKKQIWGRSSGVRPDKGHLIPEVKIANEIICEHVWDKLYLPFL
jgi:hypothetical protein